MGVILADQPELWEVCKAKGATETEKFVLWLIQGATSDHPITIADIQTRARGPELKSLISSREIKDFVRACRQEGMPILARRGGSPGYYWCKDRDEMKGFAERFIKQATDELKTLRKMLEQNYPSLISELWPEESNRRLYGR